ncbi:MAG TPA: M48 family metalloprotease [Elusimicrobiota bacterium]|nr:M48 family metalloprotease [Elusimicrobiota bacterium]
MNQHRHTTARLRVLLLVLMTGIVAGCAQNLVTKHRQFKLISEKTEISIGRKAKEDIVKEYGTYKDLDWQIYIDEVGQRLAKVSDRPHLAYDFTIVDSDEINAFAVPGGFVFITRGILSELADEAELSIVLGHEITHVAAWHGVEMLQRAGILSTLTALGAIGGMVVGAGEAAIAIAQAAGIYENLYLLGYGRQNEYEADQHGIYYAAKAGYDPEAALTFFKRLDLIEKEEMAGQHISPYWQSHPATQDRLKMAKRWIAVAEKANPGSPMAYNRDKYQSLVAKLPHGTPAERGIVSGHSYKNDPFGISLEVPDGWSLDNVRIQSLVTFVGPKPEIRGNLQRTKLSQEMGVTEYAKQVVKQLGIQGGVTSRESEYPAGHGLLIQYGGDYVRYRALLIVRGPFGYTLTCQMPSDDYLQYVVDCERIMRSLTIQ